MKILVCHSVGDFKLLDIVLGGEPARDDGITSGGGGTQALIGGGDVLPPTGAGDTGPPTGDGAYQPSTIYVKDQKCESFLQECKCYDHFFVCLDLAYLVGLKLDNFTI